MTTSDENLDGDEWKEQGDSYKDLSVRAYYDMLGGFLRHVVNSPDPPATFLSIADEFLPEHRGHKRWRQQCIDVLVDSWVWEDNVFRMWKGKKPLNDAGHRIAAYKDGLDYVLRVGEWRPEYVREAKRLSELYKED